MNHLFHDQKSTANFLDKTALLSVLHYVTFRFLQSTTFPFVYSTIYKTITFLLLILFGGIRYLYVIYNEMKGRKGEKNKLLLKCICVLFLALPFAYVGWKHDLKILIFMPITALCLYKMNPEKVFQAFAKTIAFLLFATMMSCMIGSIRNIAVIDYMGDFDYKASYGICNTTDFASYVFFILVFLWCGESTKKLNCLQWVCIVLFVAVGTFYLSGSRTAIICCFMLIVAIIIEDVEKRINNKKTGILISRCSSMISILSLPVMIMITILFIILYGKGCVWVHSLDEHLSGRIQLMYSTIQNNGITLFGTNFDMIGNGGSIFLSGERYDFLDSSYMYMIIRYGTIVSIVFFGAWECMTYRIIKSGRKRIAYAMIIMTVYAFSESHLQEINYNILVAMPFCTFSLLQDEEIKTKENNRKSGYVFITTMIGTILCIILGLPELLSWFRTIVFLQGWNSGLSTLWPLLISIGFGCLIFLTWKTILWVWRTKGSYPKTILFVFILCFGIFLYGANSVINKGVVEEKDCVEKEADVLQMIQSSAKQPVYTFERSEIYKRLVGGFSTAIIAPEDICRYKRGTVLVDINTELLPITICGGKYTQISTESGIYTFDPAVEEAMINAGYEWKTFYDSEREYNLSDLAYLNGLEYADDMLVLDGASRCLLHNRFLDQEIGTYQVNCALRIKRTSEQDKLICTLQVTGQKGEILITEKEVMASEFDERGYGIFDLIYYIPTTPRTELKILVEENEKIYIERITWKRLSRGHN